MALLWSCQDDDFSSDSSISLAFSADTLRLDTVFTARGSATYSLKIYNRSDENVMVESIRLADDSGFFRLNVDGINTDHATNVPIFANDSIYVFCEVTIDPDQPLSVSPFIIQDKIEFTTNGNEQVVYLEAWGQNANYFPSRANQKNLTRLTCDNQEILWDDDKPYVLYGVVVIDSCVLRVMEGRKIYVHGGIVSNDLGIYNDGFLITQSAGRVSFEGTVDQPIIVQDDRLEPAFEDVPGQWAAIRLGTGSTGNRFTHTVIKNSIVGIQLDSLSEADLDAVEIYNTSGSGVSSVHANLEMVNCLVHNTGGASVSVIHGGLARINYCTLSNFGNENPALLVNNFRCYDVLCTVSDVNPVAVTVRNSMLIGDDTDEIFLIDGTPDVPNDFSYSFQHVLYKANDLPEEQPDFLTNCLNCIEYDRNSPLFVDRQEEDFHLDSLSQVEGAGMPLPFVTLEDLDEQPRDLTTPDIGCYEYIYE